MISLEDTFSKINKLERVLFYTVVIAISLLLSTSFFLPMIDLPQHAGQVGALKLLLLDNAPAEWNNELTLNYFTTYWIAYFTALVLSFVMPLNYAINTVVGLAFLAFVISFSVLRKRFNGPNILDWVLLPCFFGFSFIWGFITFILAIPVGVLLLVQNLNFLEFKNNKYIIRIIIIGVLLYFSHMLIFLFFCLIASSMTIVNFGVPIKNKLKQLIPFYFLALLIPLFLLTSTFFSESGLDKYIDEYYPNYYYGLLDVRLFRLQLYPWTVYYNSEVPLDIFTIILLLLPFFMGCKLTKDIKRYVPLGAFLMVWFVFPEQAVRTAFIYQRFAIFLFPFYILIFEKKKDNFNSIEIKPIFVCAVIWLAINLIILKLPITELVFFKQQTKDFRALLDNIPERKKALSIVYETDAAITRGADVYVYFPVWYQALNQGWVDFSFAWFSPQVVRYSVAKIPEVKLGFAWNPKNFARLENCNAYDLLVVRCSEKNCNLHQELMEQSTCSHQLTYTSGSWSVYSL